MKEMMQDVVRSLMDGLKDSRMYYDYAKEAKNNKYPGMASFFIDRAKIRMKMFKEDYSKLEELDKMVTDKGDYPYTAGRWDCLHDYLMEERDKLDYLINSF